MTRGTGRTTAQMKAAPIDSVFVCCSNETYYCRHLAHHLGRGDLSIKPRAWLSRNARGVAIPVVIDHAIREVANLSISESDALVHLARRGLLA